MHLRLAVLSLFVGAMVTVVSGQQPAPKPTPIPAPADVAKPPAVAAKTASGLAYTPLQKGTGTAHPTDSDLVTVNYTGWTTDGKMFDSSYPRNAPSTFPVSKVIKGWGEGVRLMVVGEKTRFWIPEELAYKGQAGRPAGMLVFEIELLDIAPSPTAAPPDVSAPPADAQTTPSGIAYKVLRPGSGTTHPGRTSRVTVHYTGWTTDGKMFDSSVARGQPSTFALSSVIDGWTEGVQLMVAGEKTRFWIPEKLAYKGESPKGMLVFDIELISMGDMK